MNKVIITVKGKASQVLKLLDALCKERGNLTIEELWREHEQVG